MNQPTPLIPGGLEMKWQSSDYSLSSSKNDILALTA
jgi:hypothetical protein